MVTFARKRGVQGRVMRVVDFELFATLCCGFAPRGFDLLASLIAVSSNPASDFGLFLSSHSFGFESHQGLWIFFMLQS